VMSPRTFCLPAWMALSPIGVWYCTVKHSVNLTDVSLGVERVLAECLTFGLVVGVFARFRVGDFYRSMHLDSVELLRGFAPLLFATGLLFVGGNLDVEFASAALCVLGFLVEVSSARTLVFGITTLSITLDDDIINNCYPTL
jgi:hypothetical protein